MSLSLSSLFGNIQSRVNITQHWNNTHNNLQVGNLLKLVGRIKFQSVYLSPEHKVISATVQLHKSLWTVFTADILTHSRKSTATVYQSTLMNVLLHLIVPQRHAHTTEHLIRAEPLLMSLVTPVLLLPWLCYALWNRPSQSMSTKHLAKNSTVLLNIDI